MVLCEVVSLKVPKVLTLSFDRALLVSGSKPCTELFTIRCPLHLVLFVFNLPEVGDRGKRCTDIVPTFTILKIHVHASAETIQPVFLRLPLSLIYVSLNLHFLPLLPFCVPLSTPLLQLVKWQLWGLVGHASQWTGLHFWDGDNTHQVKTF